MTHTPINTTNGTLDQVLKENRDFCQQFKTNSKLMKLISGKSMTEKHNRARLLDCIQVFSDYFQKTVMLRSVFCENTQFTPVVQDHLKEEFGHNTDLARDRHYRNPVWDPVLESTSAWFAWNMLAMDNDEKTLVVHLVLESSANVFFIAADKVMQTYDETKYFNIHADLDEGHEQMGIDLIRDLTPSRYLRLIEVQRQAWDVLNAACNRIAELTDTKSLCLTD